jgi:excisionase family DNA binding protein
VAFGGVRVSSLHKCTFYDCKNEALAEEKNGFCRTHSDEQWYTVQEAAKIWGVEERTVRYWIGNKQLIAQRRGRRWLIPDEAFKGVHPSERVLPIEQDFLVDMTLISERVLPIKQDSLVDMTLIIRIASANEPRITLDGPQLTGKFKMQIQLA